MGSYAELYIGDYSIYSTKNDVDPLFLSLFNEKDLKEYKRKISQRRYISSESESNLDEIENAIEYCSNVKKVKHRLKIMGFNLDKVKKEFEYCKKEEIEGSRFALYDKVINNIPQLEEHYKKNIKILERSSFDDFMIASKEILDKKLYLNRQDDKSYEKIHPLIPFILDFHHGFESFPHFDPRSVLCYLLELCPDDTDVTYDITEIVEAGYYEKPIDIYDAIRESLNYSYDFNDKIIILSEGSSDISILNETLKILYPYLDDIYSFMDFHVSNAQGGASLLINMIKYFIGAGIKNRVIALFDNDTSARSSLLNIKDIKIPSNIKILQYPDLQYAKDYPTIGPSGINNLDVNGLACSIELYLGREIISDENGKFIPIQWKGFDQRINKYHGEILNKTTILKKFKDKINDCKNDLSRISNYDWEPLKLVFDKIFTAFN